MRTTWGLMAVALLVVGCGTVTPADEEDPGAARRAQAGHPLVDGAGGAGDQDAGATGAGGAASIDAGGTGGMTGAGGATGAPACAAAVLRANCTSCHNPGQESIYADLDLLSLGAGGRLVGVLAASGADSNAACSGKGFLLDRGTLPATGVLIDKINFRGCGVGMPYAGAMMASADRACLQAWADGLVAAAGP